MRRGTNLRIVFIILLITLLTACGGGKKPMTVSIAQGSTMSMDVSQTAALTAAVANDPKNGGVSWTVSGVGALSQPTTTSVTYTAPASGAAGTATVTATSVSDSSKTASIVITVNASPSIAATPVPPAATIGSAYSFTVPVSGGTSPFTWSVSAGALPTGLTLDSTGKISGTTNASAAQSPYAFTVKVTDKDSMSATQAYSLTVNNPPPPSITTTTLPDGGIATQYSQTIQATGGLAPFTWSVLSGTPPTGLSLNTSSTTNSTTLSGLPTTLQSSVTFTIQVKDSLGQTGTQAYTMNVVAVPIVVTILNKISSIQINQSADFAVTVQGDTQGVNWTLTANGTACSPTCGTLSKITTNTVNYTAPATVPSAPDNAPTLTATSVTDNTKLDSDNFTINNVTTSCTAQGNESLLAGQYAFSLSGFNSTGFLTVVGSFTADGTGKITAGEADGNGTVGVQHGALTTSASSYSVGSDGRGCAVIATPFGLFSTRIIVGLPNAGVATKGHIIENETGSSAYIAAGQILRQTPSAFTTAISGNYAFLTPGVNSSGNPFASMGSMNASGGNFSSFQVDSNDAGTADYASGGTGTYSSFDGNGRATGNVSIPSQMQSNFVMYMVNGSHLLVISADTPGQNPVDSGEVLAQTGTFSGTSLSGTSILAMMGSNDPSQSVVDVGTFTPSGGSFSATLTEDRGGTLSSNTETGTYTVSSSGRVVLAEGGGGGVPIIYLTAANTGFIMATGNSVSTGQVAPQTGTPFTLASISGTYIMGSSRIVRQNQESSLNSVTLTNVSSSNVNGVGDYLSPNEDMIGEAFTDTITITSGGGIATQDNPSTITAYAVNDTTFVMIDSVNSQYPGLLTGER